MPLYEKYLEFGLELITTSREFILKRAETTYKTSIKPDRSQVTEIDQETEVLMRKKIKEKFPTHKVIGEEFGITEGDDKFTWYIDPIDGTISFINKIPLYGTILALHINNEPVVGIIDLPALRQCLYAGKQMGSFSNGEKINIQKNIGDKPTIIALADRKQFVKSGDSDYFDTVMKTYEMVRVIPDVFGHSLALKGAVGIMIDFNIHIWDGAATKLITTEAGGKYEMVNETKSDFQNTRQSIIFGIPTLVDDLVLLHRETKKHQLAKG